MTMTMPMIGLDAVVILFALGLVLGVCAGVPLGRWLQRQQDEIDRQGSWFSDWVSGKEDRR